MATTVQAILQAVMNIEETLDPTSLPSLSNRKVSHSALDIQRVLNGGTTPPASMFIARSILASGSGTIDLTSLQATEGVVSAAGKKLLAIRVNVTGAHAFVLSVGASDGYPIGGVALRAEPNGFLYHYFAAALGNVGASQKNLDYTFNAASQADISLLFG